jgi:arginase
MKICAVLAPYDSGHHRQRMGLGPEHLWRSIEPALTRLGHTTRAEVITLDTPFLTEITVAFGVARALALKVRECRREGWTPLVLSGNCCASLGTVSGCGCDTTGIVWFDAHGETTTPETTQSGFLDGMGISMLTGQCWQSLTRSVEGYAPLRGERIVLVGARDVEPAEDSLLARAGVTRAARAEDLASAVAPLAQLAALAKPQAGDGVDGVYLHLDPDVIDPREATANGWTPPGGLSIDAMRDAIAKLRRQIPIKAVGFASYNPEVDRDGRGLRAALTLLEAVWPQDAVS